MSDYTQKLNDIRSRLEPNNTETDYSSTLSSIRNRLQESVVEPAVTEEEIPKGGYSQNDLVKDEFFYPIKDYMVDRFGSQYEQEDDREKVVDQFLNNRRGVAGGNSVRAVAEYSFLNEISGDEDAMARTGKAYTIYENMEGITGDTTLGERAEIVGDFVRSAVFDPTNLIGFGIGKVATSSGFKAGSMTATIMAKKAYQKKMATAVGKSAAEKALIQKEATKVATGVFTAQRAAAQKVVQESIEKRATVTAAVRSSIGKKVATSDALKEIVAVGSFEGAVAASTDYLYQDGLMRTKVQEEYNKYQTGLSAVAGLAFMGTIAAGAATFRGVSDLVRPAQNLKTTTEGAKLTDLSESIAKYVDELDTKGASPELPPIGKWLSDTSKGKELADQDTEFFIKMLLGDDDLGLRGLGDIMLDQGYAWKRRDADDTISNFIGDIIKQADPQDAKQFLDDFVQATGITMNEGKQLTVEGLANTFKRKMRDSMRVGNAASQLARKMGVKETQVTFNDYAEYVLTGAVRTADPQITSKTKELTQAAGRIIEKDLPDFQNNLIRLLVANLSTTALNVGGYTASTTLTSASDISRAALLGGRAGIALVYNPKKAKELGMSAGNILQNQFQKLRNTLDPNTTYDRFLEYTALRPEATKELSRVLPGGVEDIKKLSEGIDLDRSLFSLRSEQVVDAIQKVHLVQAQDSYTKSIEFVTQLDSALRRSKDDGGFGMSWNEFFSRPDYHKLMKSDAYINLEAKAVNETLKSIFSKSYKGKGTLGEVAAVIEDARNIPGVGLLVPFGRFFNNTVAFVAENTAVLPVLAKTVGKESDRSMSEVLSRGAVTASVVTYMAMRESEFIEKGLSWSEEIDQETGAVIDEKYEFPYGAYKAAARVVAHHMRGEKVSEELVAQIGDQFIGQLTRQLGEAGEGIDGLLTALVSSEGQSLGTSLADIGRAIGGQVTSASTRFIDPVNQAVGLLRADEYQVPDRKQGNKLFNESFRYMDQIIGAVSGDVAPEKASPSEGRLRGQETKSFSTTRESKLTSAERMLNMISRPTYLIGSYTDSAEADNRFNQIFNQIVNDMARKTLQKDSFKNGNLDQRRIIVTKVLKDAKKHTMSYMNTVASRSDDQTLLKMLEIEAKPKRNVRVIMDRLDIDKKVNELSNEELDTVLNALKFYEEMVLD
jgi:hypothetical protein